MPAKGASCSEIDPPRKSAGLCVRCPDRRNERWGHGNLRNRNGRVVFATDNPPVSVLSFLRIEVPSFRGGAPPPKSRPPFVNRGREGRKVVSCGPDSDSARFARVSQNRSGGGQPDVPCPDAPFPSVRAVSSGVFNRPAGATRAGGRSCGPVFRPSGGLGRKSLPIKCG